MTRPRIAVYGLTLQGRSSDARTAIASREADSVRFVEQTAVTRVDEALEEGLRSVPEGVDLCVALRSDESLQPGWRVAIERVWQPGLSRLRHPVVERWEEDGLTPKAIKIRANVHARRGFAWTGATVPELTSRGEVTAAYCGELKVLKDPRGLAIPDPTSPTSLRELLEIAPSLIDTRSFAAASSVLAAALAAPDALPPGARAFGLRLLAEIARSNGRTQPDLLLRGAAEAPGEREPWLHLAEMMAAAGNWPNCFSAATNALAVADPMTSWMIEPAAWNGRAEYLLELSGRRLGLPSRRIEQLMDQLPGARFASLPF